MSVFLVFPFVSGVGGPDVSGRGLPPEFSRDVPPPHPTPTTRGVIDETRTRDRDLHGLPIPGRVGTQETPVVSEEGVRGRK